MLDHLVSSLWFQWSPLVPPPRESVLRCWRPQVPVVAVAGAPGASGPRCQRPPVPVVPLLPADGAPWWHWSPLLLFSR